MVAHGLPIPIVGGLFSAPVLAVICVLNSRLWLLRQNLVHGEEQGDDDRPVARVGGDVGVVPGKPQEGNDGVERRGETRVARRLRVS